jgi:transposase InsO family protein
MIVARAFSTTPDTALVNNAVNMAVADRNRCGSTIVHADHGTQLTSWSFGENVRRWGLLASFGTVGDCCDNAWPVESKHYRRWKVRRTRDEQPISGGEYWLSGHEQFGRRRLYSSVTI